MKRKEERRGEERRDKRLILILILSYSWPDLNASMEVDTSRPLILIVNDKDLIGHEFMGSWVMDMQVLMFL